jgi:DNA-binding NarL/FixJ family response regulator
MSAVVWPKRLHPLRIPRYIGGLTKRQLEIVSYVVTGLQNKEIAGRLNISERTVRYHLSGIYRTLRMSVGNHSGRYGLLLWAINNGLFKREQIDRDIFDGVQSTEHQERVQ